TQADAILITYGDQIQAPDRPALQVLAETLNNHLQGVINSVHLLPFYPYSSDDGFSVIDYQAVDPAMGDWADLSPLHENFRLMFDAVINHISVQSQWFQGFLQGDEKYADFFIIENPKTDLSSITRPRTHRLLTPFKTVDGVKHVWTTFSADQADLNYKNPDVLLEIIKTLLFYATQGAEFIRLDAIGYLWKEAGTSSIHLPQTHRVIQLIRAALDMVVPHVILITETNVPHEQNVSYFGDGRNEAQMVYNFSLAPLVLHSLHSGSAEALQQWAASLKAPSAQTTFFNFTASHDGIGLRPAQGLLSDAEIDALAEQTLQHGGLVSYKTNPDGGRSVYELNITLFDALSSPRSKESETTQINRFMVSQAIMLSLIGAPGIYAHSLTGSSNDLLEVAKTGRARSINRQKWRQGALEASLADANSRAAQIFNRYKQLLQARAAHIAFHPGGAQDVITVNPAIFALRRTSPDKSDAVLCLHNVSKAKQVFIVQDAAISPDALLKDILSGERVKAGEKLTLKPYEVKWLTLSE
ncbi:MAG TPA: sugar phosphorylase, partial [Chloroflexi bacterium]|nr:sugar phosphorylase [Chloroflexota bacterium]